MSKIDFFISYNKAVRQWAEWIAWQLEEARYSVIIQAWDFRPGNNFISEMQRGLIEAEKVIAVISPEYMQSGFTEAEWSTAFAKDPTGKKRNLITVRVKDFYPEGLLGQVIYIDLLGLNETEAKKVILEGVSTSQRLKPSVPPKFPGTQQIKTKPPFPDQTQSNPFIDIEIPSLKEITDLDKLNFIQKSYKDIYQLFKQLLDQIRAKNSNFNYSFEEITTKKCIFKLFIEGNYKTGFKIWLGNSFGGKIEQICFSFGQNFDYSKDNSMNEYITCEINEKNELTLRMNMNMFGNKDADNPESIVKELWQQHIAYHFK